MQSRLLACNFCFGSTSGICRRYYTWCDDGKGDARVFCSSGCAVNFLKDGKASGARYARWYKERMESDRRGAMQKPFKQSGYFGRHIRRKEKKQMDEIESNQMDEIENIMEVEGNMKLYRGIVKEGCIRVAEPEGSEALIVFEDAMHVVKPVIGKPNEPSGPVPPVRKHKSDKRVDYDVLIGDKLYKFIAAKKAGGVTEIGEIERLVREAAYARGYGDMFEAKLKIVLSSIRATCYQFGMRRAPASIGVSAPVKSQPKVYVPSPLLLNGPTDISSQDCWKKILGDGLTVYSKARLEAVQPDEVIEELEAKILKAGYRPNHLKVSAFVFMEKLRGDAIKAKAK